MIVEKGELMENLGRWVPQDHRGLKVPKEPKDKPELRVTLAKPSILLSPLADGSPFTA